MSYDRSCSSRPITPSLLPALSLPFIPVVTQNVSKGDLTTLYLDDSGEPHSLSAGDVPLVLAAALLSTRVPLEFA